MQPLVKPLAIDEEFFIGEGCFVIELASQNYDPYVSIARCRVEPQKTTRWHKLVGTVERYVIQQGIGVVELSNLSPQRVTSGDVVIIPAECRQRISNPGTEDLIFLAICTPRFRTDCYQDDE
jgi:mannose-6-phosphate isomerase-like protein (cupin superfamily)